MDEDEHIVIENAHTPIIDARTFAYTQEAAQASFQKQLPRREKVCYRYSGFLYCGDCGSPMFSMSRPDLAPAYTCGTYIRRGRKGCTSHHIRVDKLDELLKSYIQIVRDNSTAILERLQDAIKQQPELGTGDWKCH